MDETWVNGGEEGRLEGAVVCRDEDEAGAGEGGGCHRRERVLRVFGSRVERKGGEGWCGFESSHFAGEGEGLGEGSDGGRG